MNAAAQNPLRLAYVSVGPADDVHEWSGLNAAIRASIIRQGCTVHDVDRLGAAYPIALRARKKLHEALLDTVYSLERTPYAASRWSEAADARIAQIGPVDAVVSPGALPVAFLKSGPPLAIWGDATFHSLRLTYPDYLAYSQASISDGDRVERAALERANLVCYASQWAADDAASHYGVPTAKLRVIPFGANCESPFASAGDAAAAVSARDWSVARFIFIGVDWQRKGGDLAVTIVRKLNDLGIKSVLTVIGCQPPGGIEALPFVESLGFLSKKNEADKTRFDQALMRSHFLLMPTTAECFGLVFAEAAAYAVPSIGRAVGGVPSAVLNGRTGMLLPADAGVDAYCDVLRPLLQDRARYGAMCAEAYQDYATRLNWRVAGERFVHELTQVVRAA